MTKAYETAERPSGGLGIVPSFCADGLVHVFGILDGHLYKKPACGAEIKFGDPPKGSEPMCLSCVGRAEVWAQGGELYGGGLPS